MSIQVTFNFELNTYIDVFDLLDFIQPHVPGDIAWTVHGHTSETSTRSADIVTDERGNKTLVVASPPPRDPIAEEIDEALASAKAATKMRGGSRNQLSGKPLMAPPVDPELLARQQQLQKQRLISGLKQAHAASQEDRRADSAAVERDIDRPDLEHLTRGERRMVLRHERKAKRATIKRAIELRRLQLLFTWLGGGDAADGEQNVLGTTCPFCEVPAGTPCRTSGGFAYSYTFHMDRFWSTAEILGLRREDFDEIFANDPEQHKLARALELLRRS